MRPVPPVFLTLVVSVCGSLATAHAQPASFELSPFVGELHGGRVAPSPGPDPGGAGNQRLDDHAYGGLRAAVFPSPSVGVELEFSRVNTSVTVRDLPCGQGGGSCTYDASLDSALVLGVVRGAGRVRPYAELGGGICRLTALFGRAGGTRRVDRATASVAIGANFAVSEESACGSMPAATRPTSADWTWDRPARCSRRRLSAATSNRSRARRVTG